MLWIPIFFHYKTARPEHAAELWIIIWKLISVKIPVKTDRGNCKLTKLLYNTDENNYTVNIIWHKMVLFSLESYNLVLEAFGGKYIAILQEMPQWWNKTFSRLYVTEPYLQNVF